MTTMASLGKFALPCSSATQEVTTALANLNFDFSMIKFEAPVEFQGVGKLLSKTRKLQAEEGSLHATARKLGVLFNENLPEIPHLLRAYGFRSSEIVEQSMSNASSNSERGPLKDFVGIDGTSVWAAATSGKGALEAHLLACILARAWPVWEAVNIWMEVIATRQALLKDRLKNGGLFDAGTMTAS